MEENNANIIDAKKRHGCVTAYLIFVIVISAVGALIYLSSIFLSLTLGIKLHLPQIQILFFTILASANVAAMILILKWKKIGFWLITASAVCAFIINFMNGHGIYAFIGLAGIIALLSVLQFERDEVSAWDNLE